jgi:cyclopropane fatty-acyl-phospholipid synthase-like methyltransferase
MPNTDQWSTFWNERYNRVEYVYGETANKYFALKLNTLTPGALLSAAEGEGRNAVFAAKQGWAVSAFDISQQGRVKALALAAKNNVHIDYQVGLLETLPYTSHSFDAMALIYAHFSPELRRVYQQLLMALLKPGGHIILEGFSKNHLSHQAQYPNVGGPRDLDMLFSQEEIQVDFPDCHIIELTEAEIDLDEGAFHVGRGSVIRFFAQKM